MLANVGRLSNVDEMHPAKETRPLNVFKTRPGRTQDDY